MNNYQRKRQTLVKQRDAKFEDKNQTETFSYVPKKNKK